MSAKRVHESGAGNLNKKQKPYQCHKLAYDPAEKAAELHTAGYTVVPVAWIESRLCHMRERLLNELKTMPEFSKAPSSYVLGGFSALGNPSSFHLPAVRMFRLFALAELASLFSTACGSDEEWHLEQLIDRVLVRPKGVSPGAESWHRDESVGGKDGDIIFGGWWNLSSDIVDIFSCVPGSHRCTSDNSKGFGLIRDKATIEICKAKRERVKVPPGHILIFHERILHEIVPRKLKQDLIRIFLGWRLTRDKSGEPMMGLSRLHQVLDAQGVVPLKSGQVPPMYAKLHWTNWRKKIVEFTKSSIVEVCTEERHVRSGVDAGSTIRVVHQHMRSLREYGLPCYAPYTEDEKLMYVPRRSWRVVCGCECVHHIVSL